MDSNSKLEAFTVLCHLVNPFNNDPPEFTKSINWRLVWDIADQTHCLPELYQSIIRLNIKHMLPEGMFESAQLIYAALLNRSNLLQAQIIEITKALNHVDIVPVWLKGANTLIKDDWQINCRLMNDLDLWLPDASQHKKALSVLDQIGYKIKPNTKDKAWKNSHHFAPRFHAERIATLEIHKHLIRPKYKNLLSDNDAILNIQWQNWKEQKIGLLNLPDQISQSFVQCTVMATPPIRSGYVRMMKVIDLLRLLKMTNKPSLPDKVLERIESEAIENDVIVFMSFLEHFFNIYNPFETDRTLINSIEKSNFMLISYSHWLRRNSMNPPVDWYRFLSNPRAWPSKFLSRFRMFQGKP